MIPHPSLLHRLQGYDSIIDGLLRINEFSKFEVGDSIRRIQNRCWAWHVGICRGRRSIQLGVGDLEMINGLSPGEVASVHDVAPLKGAGVAGEIESEDMTLGNVTNVNDVRRGLEGRAVHHALDHVVCAEAFFGDWARVGVSIRAKDESREDWEGCQNYTRKYTGTPADSLVTTSSCGCSFTNCQSARSAKSLEAK